MRWVDEPAGDWYVESAATGVLWPSTVEGHSPQPWENLMEVAVAIATIVSAVAAVIGLVLHLKKGDRNKS